MQGEMLRGVNPSHWDRGLMQIISKYIPCISHTATCFVSENICILTKSDFSGAFRTRYCEEAQ